jgi:MYXO-CTERM domain-containing protein
MDFIERIFGVSPDNGDGSTEMLYILALLAIAALFLGRRYMARRAQAVKARSE